MDEGLHLAAAVQYCGFRSVVGTMWAMVDEDGQELAENFYKALFSNSRRDQGIPYHERSAKALRFAVKKLRRKKRITLERWVNFVHYGALLEVIRECPSLAFVCEQELKHYRCSE